MKHVLRKIMYLIFLLHCFIACNQEQPKNPIPDVNPPAPIPLVLPAQVDETRSAAQALIKALTFKEIEVNQRAFGVSRDTTLNTIKHTITDLRGIIEHLDTKDPQHIDAAIYDFNHHYQKQANEILSK